MFQFVNTYISNFVLICYNQNFASLTTNLFIVMIFKQVLLNSFEYLEERITVGRRIRKSNELFSMPLEDAKNMQDDLQYAHVEMHCVINRQIHMKPATTSLVYFYNEAIIQLGFIAFFATAFPFAPLFSFLTNLLEIAIKMQHIAKYGRRNFAMGTSGIGSWNSIMAFISYGAIPINGLILLLCRFPDDTVGFFQDMDDLKESEESVMVQWLHKKNPNFWNRSNIILFGILMEHIAIAIKIVIAILIPDVPDKVKEDEQKRIELMTTAEAEMAKMKMSGKYETFDDL